MSILKKLSVTTAGAAIIALGYGAGQANAVAIVDSVNADKSPADGYIWTATEVGWDYTPSAAYNLVGVNTKFGFETDSRTVSVEVYDASPSNGGTLLRSGNFTPLSNNFSGGTFAPLSLTAGDDYFIGFRNVDGLGVNVTEDAEATSLPFRYSFDNDGSYSNTVSSGSFITQPILQFEGPSTPVPFEFSPGVGILALGALGGLNQIKNKVLKRKFSKSEFSAN